MDDETKEILRELATLIAKGELYTERITRRLYEVLTPAQKEELGTVDDLMGVERREVDEYWQQNFSMLEGRFPELFDHHLPVPGAKRSTANKKGKQ